MQMQVADASSGAVAVDCGYAHIAFRTADGQARRVSVVAFGPLFPCCRFMGYPTTPLCTPLQIHLEQVKANSGATSRGVAGEGTYDRSSPWVPTTAVSSVMARLTLP